MPTPSIPLVSVCTTSYNAASYIRQCVESVLAQKTSFKIEYVIGDDMSTDGTAEIIGEYADRHPDIIRFRHNTKNLGMISNNLLTIKECRGEYIAFLDGDDYWIDPNKLEMQVDFMKKNPDCAFCGTATDVYYQDTGKFVPGHPELPVNDHTVRFFGIEEFYKPWLFWFPTHSLLIRRDLLDYPKWLNDVVYLDRALRLLLSLKGSAAYINTTTCVYRKHSTNVTNKRPHSLIRRFAETYINVYHYSGKKHYKIARGSINETIYAERMVIRKELTGLKKFYVLLSNSFFALREFRPIELKDILRIPYHFMFIGDLIDLLRRKPSSKKN